MTFVDTYLNTLPLRDRWIAEKILHNLEMGDGKWRIFFDAARGVDNKFTQVVSDLLPQLADKHLIATKVVHLADPRGGRYPMIRSKMYRFVSAFERDELTASTENGTISTST